MGDYLELRQITFKNLVVVYVAGNSKIFLMCKINTLRLASEKLLIAWYLIL